MMFLLPSSPLNIKKVDPEFEQEFYVLKHLDFKGQDQFIFYSKFLNLLNINTLTPNNVGCMLLCASLDPVVAVVKVCV